MIRYRVVKNPEQFANELAAYFQTFYGGHPFHEDRWVCSTCNPPENPSLGLTNLQNAPGFCSNCDSEFELFWSVNRLYRYLSGVKQNAGFWMYAGFEEDKMLAWIWGYDKPIPFNSVKQAWYIDFIGIDSSLRRKKWESFLVTLVMRFKLRYGIRKSSFFIDTILRWRKVPIADLVIASAIHSFNDGKEAIWCRTLERKNVLVQHLNGVGFKRVGQDVDHPDRSFFSLDI